MRDFIQTVLALAERAPGFDDPANRADFERARPVLEACDDLLTAARDLLSNWDKGNLSAPMQALQAAVLKASPANGNPPPGHVRRFLDLSTAHLDDESRGFLEGGGEGVTSYPLTYGWLVYVSEPGSLACYEVPGVLLEILSRARALGCEYVLLDSDAEMDAELPVFEEAA